jgi:hypothetical protein
VKRLALIVAALAALAVPSLGLAYIAAHATATAKFHVAEGSGAVRLSIDSIEGNLGPGDSLAVHFTVTNPEGNWNVRVGRVTGDDPLVTGLPDDCPASAFDFNPVAVSARLDGGEHVNDTGRLTLSRKAPIECAGADPTLHLQVGN